MSGHSKWSKIKHQKQAKDAQKGNIFAKVSKAITLAVIEGGGITDPENNVHLRLAIEKARALNTPKDNITRAIEKGAGPDKNNLKSVLYEAFGPAGAALLIAVTTDNSNRTFAEIRTVLERNGGKMAGQGAVAYLFERCGTATFPKSLEESVMEFAEKVHALDFEEDEDSMIIYFPFAYLGKLKEYLKDMVPTAAEIDYKPTITVPLTPDQEQQLIALVDSLEELDDVSAVYTNGILS